MFAFRSRLAGPAGDDARPPDFDLLDPTNAPDSGECEVRTGPMVRIVDVVEPLSTLSSPDREPTVTLSIEDPVAPWNDGPVRLTVADGIGECERTDAGPDATLDVGAPSQLAVGYRSARDLRRAGRSTVGSNDATATLDRLFPTARTYLGDRF